MDRRNPARFLAPLALLAVMLATVVIVAGARDSTATSQQGERPAASTTTKKQGRQARGRRYYTIQSGDLLTSIAQKTGVSVERIQQLNPDLDPQALPVGQRIRVR
jgi:N-acetylmuramoyl-L-alanine amidase